MECRGNILQISQDLETKQLNVLLLLQTSPEKVQELKQEDLSVTIVEYRNKRSLNANAYFHVLVGKIADAMHISKARAKNILICRYGQQEFIGDHAAVIKANIPVEWMLEQETLHCQPCGVKVENGKDVNFYRVYRGSHTYDTKEMSVLIDGTVQEAKELGIETLPPDELKRMVERWQ